VNDPYMLAVWADVNAPALVVAPNSGNTRGQPNFQDAVFLDGTTNERLAIDGAGTLQWSASLANTFLGSAWDTTLARVAAGLLETQGLHLTAILENASQTFAGLPAPASLPNGAQLYCSDCAFNATNAPCVSGGTGAMAFLINGAWICN
jgi:hypothetical protein